MMHLLGEFAWGVGYVAKGGVREEVEGGLWDRRGSTLLVTAIEVFS
jgi:hypothetical protein